MLLFINACVRENSRTLRIAKAFLKDKEYVELKLDEMNLLPLNNERLEIRNKLLEKQDYNNPMFALSRQFSQADEIVIAAPFWDNAFPALLKIYLENIYVIDIVSKYDEMGNVVGLCKAKTLTYITTAGAKYISDYSFDYIKTTASVCFGIKEVKLIKAEMLDIDGVDANRIVDEVIKNMKA